MSRMHIHRVEYWTERHTAEWLRENETWILLGGAARHIFSMAKIINFVKVKKKCSLLFSVFFLRQFFTPLDFILIYFSFSNFPLFMYRSLLIYLHVNVCSHLFLHFTTEDVVLLQAHYIPTNIRPACQWESSDLIGCVTWYLLFDRLAVAGHGFLWWILCIFKETRWFTSKTSFSLCWEMHINSQPDL